ncbi:unnamed protein product [Arabidopsis thaliana]|uniref:Uncharacterized protein n=1 Tax=Arabidopsis thaliana TaxID=3702 RepID=A0A654ESQ4_ARATH|nr:unnamed protein product [Arabidopsis thaliana]
MGGSETSTFKTLWTWNFGFFTNHETSTSKALWTWNFGFFTNHVCKDLRLQDLMDIELLPNS